MADKFWMVWVEGRGAPTVRHADERSATAEAARLAKHEKRTAYVLEAVRGFAHKKPDIPVYVVEASPENGVAWAGTTQDEQPF